ncbi:MAG: TIGR00730 family Rossman fold protein [Dysgonamonadaceae bacterium]|jgi:uncharacterized protein (TIGR00730 family)|nr:TIGR00730 family Rossman fold protein [Dysgonamonadaceae bacterium]
MASRINTVTVYAASSSQLDTIYFSAAEKIGRLLAQQKITCINGAGKSGLMGKVSDSILENGGKVIGIIPRFMEEQGWYHPGLTEKIVTDDMHERKKMMANKSDACIALPGGIGTMEELLEIITWKQLGLYKGLIVILNINGYYNDLLNMLARAKQESFMHDKHSLIWKVAENPEQTLDIILENPQWEKDPLSIAAL